MTKEKRILSYFFGWLVIGFLVCFIGITNVFADEMERVGFLSDKTDIQIVVPYNGTPLTLDQYGEYYLTEADQLLVFIDNYNFIAGDIYQLELYLPNATLTNANVFTVSGTTSNNETVSCSVLKILQDNKQYVNYRWRCNKDVDSLTFTIKNSNNENIVSAGTFRWDYSFLWNVLSTTDNSEIIDGLDKVEDAIIESNKETQDVIKDELNTCRPSYNLLKYTTNTNTTLNGLEFIFNEDGTIKVNGTATSNTQFYYILNGTIPISAGTYTFSGSIGGSMSTYRMELRTSDFVYFHSYDNSETITLSSDVQIVSAYIYVNNGVTLNNVVFKPMLQKGSVATTYEPYGEEICTNKLDEAEETRKGIWETIKDLPNQFMNMLKGLFIPEDGYFEEWFNDLKLFFEEKLGFLATPFTIIIDFISRYLELNPQDDIIINIPDITVPNFEEHVIVQATTLNWSQLLKSKESLYMLWELYLSFIDVYLILNFINLCENKYNRIFGGDTTQYEYYTVEDSYTVNDNTGELTNHRRNQRTTTRKKVN